MDLSPSTLEQSLQIAGWVLTAIGQIQIALKARQAFISWIAANVVLIVLCARVGLWWSIGMYLTNVGICLWSYHRWGGGQSFARPLFVKRAALWNRSPWS